MTGKNNRKYVRDVKTIPGELQHRPVVANFDKKLKKFVKKDSTMSREIWKLEKKEI